MENQLKKEPRKGQWSSSVMNQSQPLFKMEEKVDIKSYNGGTDSLKLSLVATTRRVFKCPPNWGRTKEFIFLAKIGIPCPNLVGKTHVNPKVVGRYTSE